jgi:hypothetical protein
VTTVAALVVRWLSGRRVRRRQAERTRAALAELFAAMGAEMDAAMASVRAALAAMPPERYAALSWADPEETPRHPAGCPMTPQSDRV